MRWTIGYVAAAGLLLGPVVMRVALRTDPTPAPLDPGSVALGKVLFEHEWTENDPLANGGDGLGPVFNAKSCVACHKKGGIGGADGNEHNVTTCSRPATHNSKAAQGVIHAFAIDPKYQETLKHADPRFPDTASPTLAQLKEFNEGNGIRFFGGGGMTELSQRNTPALFGAKLID